MTDERWVHDHRVHVVVLQQFLDVSRRIRRATGVIELHKRNTPTTHPTARIHRVKVGANAVRKVLAQVRKPRQIQRLRHHDVFSRSWKNQTKTNRQKQRSTQTFHAKPKRKNIEAQGAPRWTRNCLAGLLRGGDGADGLFGQKRFKPCCMPYGFLVKATIDMGLASNMALSRLLPKASLAPYAIGIS